MIKSKAKYVEWFHNYEKIESSLLNDLDQTRMSKGFHAFRNNVLLMSLQDIKMAVEILSCRNIYLLREKSEGWLRYLRESKTNPLFSLALTTSTRHLLKDGCNPDKMKGLDDLVDQELENCRVKPVNHAYVTNVSMMEKKGIEGEYFYGYNVCRNTHLQFQFFDFKDEFSTLFLRMFFGFKGELSLNNNSIERRLANAIIKEDYFAVCVALCFLKTLEMDVEKFRPHLIDAASDNLFTALCLKTEWLVP